VTFFNYVGSVACVRRCPRGVEIIDIMRALRKTVVEFGVVKVLNSLRIAVYKNQDFTVGKVRYTIN
jgi:heterodisulfide reductase subunit C